MNNRVRRITFIGVICAVAIILSYVEMLLPPIYAAVPGVKVGLPNIVIILVLYRYGVKSAAAVSLIRLIVTSALFGFSTTFFYSLAGAVLSLGVMALLKRTNAFSTVGVSISGGVMHNLGQIIVAILMLGTVEIGYYMFVLAISGTLAGIFIGIASSFLIARLKKY